MLFSQCIASICIKAVGSPHKCSVDTSKHSRHKFLACFSVQWEETQIDWFWVGR